MITHGTVHNNLKEIASHSKEDNMQWGWFRIDTQTTALLLGQLSFFRAGRPENVIMERSGHRSTDGVRQYERVSPDQHIAAQAILTARDGFRAYDAELQSVQKRKKAIKESPTKSV